MTQHYESIPEEEEEDPVILNQEEDIGMEDYNHGRATSSSATSSIRGDGDNEMGSEGTSNKKRSLPFADEIHNLEYQPFPIDLVKSLIQAQYFLAPARQILAPALQLPLSLFSGDRKLAAIVQSPTNRVYLICKVISPKYISLYYVIYQNVSGLRSSILRQLSNLEKSSPDIFLNHFRWIEHPGLNNVFLLVLLRCIRLFFSGTDIAVITKKCLTFGVKSLLKEFQNSLPSQYCTANPHPQKCLKK